MKYPVLKVKVLVSFDDAPKQNHSVERLTKKCAQTLTDDPALDFTMRADKVVRYFKQKEKK